MSLEDAAAALDKLLYGVDHERNTNRPLIIEGSELKKRRARIDFRAAYESDVENQFYKCLDAKKSMVRQPENSHLEELLDRSTNNGCSCIAIQTWNPSPDITTFSRHAAVNECFPITLESATSGNDQRYAFSTSTPSPQIDQFQPLTSFMTPELLLSTSGATVVKQYSDDFSNLRNFEFTALTTSVLEDFAPLDPTKYKTELCRSYQVHGVCKYGIRCNYAHGLNQLKVSFRHGKYKTRNCQSYHETGFCRYGARCSFIHDPEEGILKCPITEREVLEALHYRPMAEFHHHVAAITWRVLGTKCYPPTELHFFTPAPDVPPNWNSKSSLFSDDGISSESSVLSIETSSISSPNDLPNSPCSAQSRIVELEVEQGCHTTIPTVPLNFVGLCPVLENSQTEQVQPNTNATLNSPTNQISTLTSANEVPVGSNLDEIKQNEPTINKINIKENSSALKLKTNEKIQQSQTIQKTTIRNISDVTKLSKETQKQCRLLSRSAPKQSGGKNLFISSSIKSFRLEDFLRCLKTREGQHHLAPWPPEMEKKISFFNQDPKPSLNPSWKSENPSPKPHFAKGTKDMSKFKTELCRSFQYNQFCEYGESCLYAHGTRDLRLYPKHPMYRTKKCFSFHHKGFCLYGSRCQFLHDIE